MTIEQIREAYNAQPFQPFVIHLADGREISIPSREFMMTSPTGRTIGVFQPDGRANIIDLLLVTDLELKPSPTVPADASASASAPQSQYGAGKTGRPVRCLRKSLAHVSIPSAIWLRAFKNAERQRMLQICMSRAARGGSLATMLSY